MASTASDRGAVVDRAKRVRDIGELLGSEAAVLPAKLAPPAPRPGVVPRRALVDRLCRADNTSVVTLLAPAGYGKSITLVQWASRDPRPFAWVSVDQRFDDPAVLLTYLAHALDAVIPIEPEVFEGLAVLHLSERFAVLAGLASSVATAPHPFVLAIDDCHLLGGSEGIDTIRTLVEHLPPGSQVALSGRGEPTQLFARIRSEGSVLDFGTADLRFSSPEAEALLDTTGVDLPERELSDLISRTEGWAAGLYFAALAMKAGGARPRVSAFGGSDRLFVDYVRSELLTRIPEQEMQFLTRSSLLDELSGPLCDAALERSGSADELEKLEASNLLLVPLDRQRQWYRYHRLFQEMLRGELERLEPEETVSLARRASDWCADHELPDRAVHYAQIAQDVDRVCRIVLEVGMGHFVGGRAATLAGWFDWLEEHGSTDAAVAVLGAWLGILEGRSADAERWLAVAEQGSYEGSLPDGSSSIEGWIRTLRAGMAKDVEQTRFEAKTALKALAPASNWRPVAAVTLGAAELFDGNAEAADAHLTHAAEWGAIMGAPGARSVALALLAVIAIRRDRWEEAETLVEQATETIDQASVRSLATSALTFAVRARVSIHRGDGGAAHEDIEAAERSLPYLSRALAILAVETRLELARVLVTMGDVVGARQRLDEAKEVLDRGYEFGTLQSDAEELSAKIEEVRATAPGAPMFTPAELRLLPLLATHLSFPDIARRLFVSPHTVKSQGASIYRKLGVSSRAQAVERARTFGSIPA